MSAAARTLLIADDSITIQKVVDLTFRDEGFSVTTVSNGTAAIEIIERIKPDIVLLDAQMPKPDGYEVCRRIKRDERLRHIPVLLLINSFEPYNEAEARRAGADDTLTKPFQSIRELVNKVSGMLSPARPSDEAEETKPIDAEESNRTREDSRPPEAISPPLATQAFEPETVAALPAKDDARHHHADEPMTEDAESLTRKPDTKEEAQVFAPTVAEDQADDDGMIQIAELSAPHSSTASSSSSAPTFRSNDDELEILEQPAESSPLDTASYFDAPLSPASVESDLDVSEVNTVHDASMGHDTYRRDDLLQLDVSTPESFSTHTSNDEAINTEYIAAEEPDTAMTPQDEPHDSSNDFSDKPQTDNFFDDNLFDDKHQAANEPVSKDDFPLALADDAPLDLGETQAAPSNNLDDSILDFGDAPAVVPAKEQYAPAMMDRESFEFTDDVEVTNVEAMDVEETAPATFETSDAIAPLSTLNALPPEVIEHIARQVVAHLSESVLREVAWEVVPQLAERLIKQRLDEDAKPGE